MFKGYHDFIRFVEHNALCALHILHDDRERYRAHDALLMRGKKSTKRHNMPDMPYNTTMREPVEALYLRQKIVQATPPNANRERRQC